MHSCSLNCHLSPDSRIYTSGSNLQHGLQAHVSICLLDTSLWASQMHLMLSVAGTEVHKPPPSLGVSVLQNGLAIHPVAPTRNLGVILEISFFLTHCLLKIQLSPCPEDLSPFISTISTHHHSLCYCYLLSHQSS